MAVMAFIVGGVLGLLSALVGWGLFGLSALAAVGLYLGVAFALGGGLIVAQVLRHPAPRGQLQRL
jgi:hypothetical protein